MRPLLSVLLVLRVSCLPADQLMSEGSGDELMLSDAADPEVLPEDLPLGLKTPQSEDGDDKGAAEKDELFDSLADLLKQMQTLEAKQPAGLEPDSGLDPGVDPELEPGYELQRGPESKVDTMLELEAGSETETETEPEPNSEPVPEPVEELGEVEEEEPAVEPEQEEQQTNPDPEQTEHEPEQEPEESAGAAREEESTGQEHRDHESGQGQSGTEKPDLGTTVFPVQLLNVRVVSEPDVPEEAAVARDPVPADEPLEQNEVPLPAPARQPVEEPLIIAETASCLGCVTPILQDGADLRRVANMAAKLIEEELDSRYTFRVMEVYRASKQVVNGIKYSLTLEVAATSCERPLPPFTLCFVASDAPRLLYAVEILHQPHRANTELLNLREMDRSELAGFGGLFAAATAEPAAAETPQRQAAPIESSDSLLDILMGLDSVISQQRSRQPAAPEDRPLQADIASGPPVQPERAGPPPPLQADWQAEIQQRHSTSRQALRVQALLREAGWPAPAADAERRLTSEPEMELQMETEGQQEQEVEVAEEEPRCREARQYDVQQVPLNVAHPRVQKILHKFLETQERSGSQRLVITELRSATQQTIAETNYRFEFVLGVSACLKNSTAHRYSCSATSASPLSDCRVRARHRPGRPLQFNTVSCTTKRQPQCANGHCQVTEIHPYAPLYVRPPTDAVDVDIHDPTYQQLVQHVQNEVNRRSRRPFLKKFIKTLNATKVSYNLEETSEIIDQELYSLTLRFAETGCARTVELDSQEGCLEEWHPTGDTPHPTSVCDVRVSSLGWADRMRVLDLFCETEVAPDAA